jgi:hypothetical protein
MLKWLGAIVVLAVLACACGSNEQPEPQDATPTAAASPEGLPDGYDDAVRAYYGDDPGNHAEDDVEAEYHQPPQPPAGEVGDTITLTGSNIGVRALVTVTGVEDSVEASEPARQGTRYVAVDLKLRSTGITIIEGEVAQAELAYAGGRTELVTGVEAECSNGFEKPVRIESEKPVRGCVLFEVPTGRDPRELQLALEQVPAEVGGIWRLG